MSHFHTLRINSRREYPWATGSHTRVNEAEPATGWLGCRHTKRGVGAVSSRGCTVTATVIIPGAIRLQRPIGIRHSADWRFPLPAELPTAGTRMNPWQRGQRSGVRRGGRIATEATSEYGERAKAREVQATASGRALTCYGEP